MKKADKIMSSVLLVGSLLLAVTVINPNNSSAQENSGPGSEREDRFRIDERLREFRDEIDNRMRGMGLTPGDMRNARVFSAILVGDKEVPAVNTNASGTATVFVLPNRNELMFILTVKDIQNVTAAHIHLGREGENGPVVVTLFPMTSRNQDMFGQGNGVLAKGTIIANDLSGTLAGRTVNDLVMEIERGNAYVNVHTNQNPNGEIRDQLEMVDMSALRGMMNR